jgi:acetyl-CoA acetyltransferase
MGVLGRKSAIVGVYASEQARTLPRTKRQVELECIRGALADAGLSHKEVDGLIPMDFNTPISLHMEWAEQLGGRPIGLVEVSGGAGSLSKAALGIAGGQCEVVVIFFANAGYRIGPGHAAAQPGAPRLNDMNYMIHGAYMSPWYAMWTRRYVHEFRVDPAHLSEYPVIARRHATLNPASMMGAQGEITLDDVYASRMIADPLHRLECPLDNDGGYAIVVASEAVARNCRKPPVWILGGDEATYTDPYYSISPDWFPEQGQAVRRATEIAFGQAGVGRDDIDVASLYDCFPVTVARDLEEMGFCARGEGAAYIHAGHLTLEGKLPTNTDGGLLSNSHPGNPGGLQVIEVARQLRGEADRRQAPGAKLGVVLSQGWAVHGLAGVAVLAAD